MIRLLPLALLLALAAPARAYSIVWGQVLSAKAEASAIAWEGWDGGYYSDYHVDEAIFPGEHLPLSALATASTPSCPSIASTGTATTDGVRLATEATGHDGDFCSSASGGRATYSRSFCVLGGSGFVDVAIPFLLRADGDGASAHGSWEVGVDGVGSVSGAYDSFWYNPYAVHEELAWAGQLEFGRAYWLTATGASYTGDLDATLSLELLGAPAPVPEPATWALLGVGIVGLALLQGRRP